MTPRVSVIICTYNRDTYIGRCINKILNQDLSPASFEIIVVNNKCTDNTDEICQSILVENPEVRINYVIEEQQGLSFSRNRGTSEAQGEILVFIDDDALAEKEFLTNLIDFYDNHPEVSVTGGKIYPLYEVPKPNWLSKFLMPLMSVIDLGDTAKQFKNGKYPIGANMAFRNEIIQSIGGFNTSLGRVGKNLMGGEEKDIFQRIRSKNNQIWYVPNVIVHHAVTASRLEKEFIQRQGKGIGMSERIRVSESGKIEQLNSILKEFFKWGASILLSVGYTLTLQPQKGIMILKFRFWVSKGRFIKSTVQ